MARRYKRTDKDVIRQLGIETVTLFLMAEIKELRTPRPGRPGISAEVDEACAVVLERAVRYINSRSRNPTPIVGAETVKLEAIPGGPQRGT